MSLFHTLLLVVAVLVASCCLCNAHSSTKMTHSSSKRPFSAQDLHALKRVSFSDAALSATQGSHPISLFTVSEWDSDTNEKRTSVSYVNMTTSDVVSVTKPDWGIADTSPVLLNDGKTILFLSTRAGSQLRPYITDLKGRSPEPLEGFALPENIAMGNLVLAPNGEYFIFSTDVFVDCHDFQCTADRLKKQDQEGYMVFDQLYIRHWDTYSQHTVQHLFIQQLNTTTNSARGNPIDLMEGMNADSPVKPFGGTEQIAISSDSSKIAFNAEKVRHDTAWRTDWDIYVTSFRDGKVASPKLLTGDRDARTQNPIFSSDGKSLYFGAMKIPQAESDRVVYVRHDLSTGKEERITDGWDRSIDGVNIDSTGKYLIVEAYDDGVAKVFSVSLETHEVKELISSGANHGLAPVRDRKGGIVKNIFTYARSSTEAPNDIFTATFDASKNAMDVKQLTHVNKDLLNQVQIVQSEKFYFPCDGAQPDQGKGCQAWILKPINFDSSKTYPTAQLVHGGPQGAWDSSWSYRWNPQVWASRGYFVVMINPQGSVGFGTRFTEAVSGDWGGVPYRTLQKGLDAFLDHYSSNTDPKMVGMAGASYGGFMAIYTSTQTQRYKAIVAHDGVFDVPAIGYTGDELFFNEREFGGPEYRDPEGYEKFNPRKFIKNVGKDQNILIIQGLKDYRIPSGQGIGYFTALQRMGINSRIVIFKEENHWVLNQRNSLAWHREVLGWMDDHVKP